MRWFNGCSFAAHGEFRANEFSVRAEQSPIADSRVTLTNQRDALGMPRVALDWRIAPEDDVQMRRGLIILASELAAAGIARAWVPGDASRFVWRQMPGGHHMGTTRMGTDPAVSVVDANCRAHEVAQSLHRGLIGVSDRAATPIPTLTIVALAHRLADTLKGREMNLQQMPRREFLVRRAGGLWCSIPG